MPAELYSEIPVPRPDFSAKASLFHLAYLLPIQTVGKPKLERLEQRLAAHESRLREHWRSIQWQRMIETFSKY
jgi:hypothetical protein